MNNNVERTVSNVLLWKCQESNEKETGVGVMPVERAQSIGGIPKSQALNYSCYRASPPLELTEK
jgi:hypothetical protein